jgi:hypothetical protein
MNSTVRAFLFWVLLIVLAVVLWKMTSARPKAAHGAQSADAGAGSADTGTVVVESAPSGADIYVDAKFVGDAPATLTLAPGQHAVRLSMNGYKDWTRDLSVLASSKVNLDAALEKK